MASEPIKALGRTLIAFVAVAAALLGCLLLYDGGGPSNHDLGEAVFGTILAAGGITSLVRGRSLSRESEKRLSINLGATSKLIDETKRQSAEIAALRSDLDLNIRVVGVLIKENGNRKQGLERVAKATITAGQDADLALERGASEAAMSIELLQQMGALSERLRIIEQAAERQGKLNL